MTGERERRIAIMQHARRQRRQAAEVAALVPGAAILPVDPADSLSLEEAVRRTVPRLREEGRLKRERFGSRDKALDALAAGLGRLAHEGLWELHGRDGAGFFKGVDQSVLAAWLAAGNDGFSVVTPGLEAGRVVDVVIDDAWEGSFVEIESW